MLFVSLVRTSAAALAFIAAGAGAASAATVTSQTVVSTRLSFAANKTVCPPQTGSTLAGKYVHGDVTGDLVGSLVGCLYSTATAGNAATVTYAGTVTIKTSTGTLGFVIAAVAINGAGGTGNAALTGSYTVIGPRNTIGSVGAVSGFSVPGGLYLTLQGPLTS
jgi:hypothetical protein